MAPENRAGGGLEVDQRGDSTRAINIRKKITQEISEKLGRRIELRGSGQPKKDKK